MGSSQKQRQKSNTHSDQTMTEDVTGIAPYQKQFAKQYGNLAFAFQDRIKQPLNLEYRPAFSATPDTIVQNMVSQGNQNIKGAESAANAELANRLAVAGTGNNSALLAALQRRGQYSTAGAQNALIPAALEQQRAFDVARQNIINAQNQTKLAGRAQSINELMPGMNLLQAINQMAQTSAGKKTRNISDSTSESYAKAHKSWF